MIVRIVPSGPFATNAYLVACPNTKEAAIIDPGLNSLTSIVQALEELNVKPIKILLTHSHWDHIGDVHPLKERFNLPVYIHKKDEGNLLKPGSDAVPLWSKITPVKPDGYFTEGDVIKVGNLSFDVIETPGHTPGGVCFYESREEALFAGDTLFQGSIGNLSLPTANPEQMWLSLKKLSKLPPSTKVYPGHGPATTIGDESWLPNAQQIFS